MTPEAQVATELVSRWYDLQRQGWEAHHCQHATTCIESFNAKGLDEIDREALAQEIAQAIEQARREEREACAKAMASAYSVLRVGTMTGFDSPEVYEAIRLLQRVRAQEGEG